MKNEAELITQAARPASLREILRSEWRLWLPGAIACFLLASLMLSGWPEGLIPNVHYPFIYAGDGLSHTWLTQRAIEGWIFDNPRSGYPFGSNFLDYPGSDGGNYVVLKFFGQFTGNAFIAINLYFLTSFAVIFVSAYAVMRALGIGRAFAIAGAVLFDFIPFHFQRIGHLFYTWYFVAPLFFYVALRIADSSASPPASAAAGVRHAPRWLVALGLVTLGCFGVYYAIFGIILLAVVLLYVVLGKADRKAARQAVLAMCFVASGVLLNIAPNILHQRINGVNEEVGQRQALESELYAFKMVQLLLPRPDHRVERMASIANKYNSTFMPINENVTSSLGVVGAIGFLGMFFVLVAAVSERKVDRNLKLIALFTFVLFLFGTLGGFGSLFSQLISASIRGWNRISIFIGFGALAGLFLLLQGVFAKSFAGKRLLVAGFAGVIAVLGLLDQNSVGCKDCNLEVKRKYELDRDFVTALEKSLPEGSAIYQLPYMAFPEAPPLFKLQGYDPAGGFLHSRALKWSYGGMRAREGDYFYRALSLETPEKQIDVARRLGFSGIYLDRRGYADNGQAVVQRFTELLGAPTLQRGDGEIVFFPLGAGITKQTELSGLSAHQLMNKAGYVADKLGPRYEATLAQGIDFKRPDFPTFVKDINGFSVPEPWGRWTDAGIAPVLKVDLVQSLPRRFTFALTAMPFGPNAGKDVAVRIGTHTMRFRLKEGLQEYRKAVDLGNETVSRIEIIPPDPRSPAELGMSVDGRKLGVGMIRLAIE